MSFLILCILCIVQGLTEFLPVSSSGHLTLFEQIFKVEMDMLLLNLFLHLASLFAVIIFYRKKILNLIKKPFQPISYKLIGSSGVTFTFAYLYKYFDINKYIFKIYGFCFFITAIILLVVHYFQKNSVIIKKKEVSYKDALIVGLVQGCAVIPGISRSGSTIASLLFLKNEESISAEYSFLLSIPIIFGGFIFELLEVENYSSLFININIYQYIFAFILTFIVALISLKLTVKMLKNQKFNYFSAYLAIISIIVLILNF